MPSRTESVNTFELFLTRLRESHDVCVYEAIDRLVQAGATVGLESDALIRMLDQGVTFKELLALIESKMECLQQSAA